MAVGQSSQVRWVWVRAFKKGPGEATVTYAEALGEALCFGWIDAQKRRHDKTSERKRHFGR